MDISKPTLLQLTKQTGIHSQKLAQEAGVSLGDAYAVQIGGFVSPSLVEKVVAAFNRLTGSQISSKDISYNSTRYTSARRISNI